MTMLQVISFHLNCLTDRSYYSLHLPIDGFVVKIRNHVKQNRNSSQCTSAHVRL